MSDILDGVKSFEDLISKKLSADQSQAIKDALESIIMSRRKGGGGGGPLPPEIELDPRLKKPKQKNKQKQEKDPRDIKFDDPDKILKPQKGDSGGDFDDDVDDTYDLDDEDSADSDDQDNSNDQDNSKDASDDKSGKNNDSKADGDKENSKDGSDTKDNQDSKDGKSKENSKDPQKGSENGSDNGNKNKKSDDKPDESDLKKKLFGDKKDKINNKNNNSKDGSNSSDHGVNLTQDQLAYNNLNRIIKHLDTVSKNIESRPDLNISEETKESIKKASEHLKELKEKVKKQLANKEHVDIESIEQEIQNAIDVVSQVSKVKVDSDPEARARKIKKDLSDRNIRQAIENEDRFNKNTDINVQKRRGAFSNLNEYSKVKTLREFEIDFYNSIRDQIQMHEDTIRSLSELDPQAEDEDIVSPGEYQLETPIFDKPIVYVYIDCSGSWSEYQTKAASLTASIKDFVDRGLCEVVMHWFKEGDIYNEPVPCRGGSAGYNEILDQIEHSDANNVIFVSDSDTEEYARREKRTVYIPGEVWWVWSRAEKRCESAQKHLIGEISGPDPTEYALS